MLKEKTSCFGRAFFPKERWGHESKDRKEEIAPEEKITSSDTEAERNFERITSMDGGKVKYRVKSFDEAEKTLSVIREITWE